MTILIDIAVEDRPLLILFLEYAGEMHIIVLREKKRAKTALIVLSRATTTRQVQAFSQRDQPRPKTLRPSQ